MRKRAPTRRTVLKTGVALAGATVTADTAIDLRQRCLAAGADDVIFKPVAMDDLFDSMGRVLARGAADGASIT